MSTLAAPTLNTSPINIITERFKLRPESDLALYMQIAESIEWSIGAGLLPPGTPLPSYGSLGRRLGVDRATVQKAYRFVLLPRKLITIRKGAGSFVSQIDRAATLQESASRQFRNAICLARSAGIKPDQLTALFLNTLKQDVA